MAGKPYWERKRDGAENGPPTVEMEKRNRAAVTLGTRVMLKRILETGKTYGPIPEWAAQDVITAMLRSWT